MGKRGEDAFLDFLMYAVALAKANDVKDGVTIKKCMMMACKVEKVQNVTTSKKALSPWWPLVRVQQASHDLLPGPTLLTSTATLANISGF